MIGVSGESNPDSDLPKSFREHFLFEALAVDDPDSFNADGSGNIYGGIVFDSAGEMEPNHGSVRSLQTKVDFPVQASNSFSNPEECHRFVNRVYGYCRWMPVGSEATEISDLVEFHTYQKLTLLAHAPAITTELGHGLANPPQIAFDQLLKQYRSQYSKVLRQLPTRQRHFNVLEHLYGYLSELLPNKERIELLEEIRDFHDGDLPLIEPLTSLKRHFEDRSIDWVNQQSYINPTQRELALKRKTKS